MADIRRMRPLLGTYVEVGARGGAAPAAVQAAFASIETAQALWSFHDRASELSRLNLAPGQAVPLSSSTLRLLRSARAMMRASDGLFDCTVGGALVRCGALPDHGGRPALERGSAADIEIGAHWARLRRPVRLTLDGIAKGYAVDLAVRALRRAGAEAGWVNAGGDVRVFGALVLPMHRRELDGAMLPLGGLRDAAMASSRAGHHDDAQEAAAFPAHIVAPPRGVPASGIWTVLARSAWRADALTKVAANAAPAARAALVRALGGALIDPTEGPSQ
ncbi:FAD:protein FMN transferase [Massilia sp. CCM 8695]|uniref:FAD:protein FMN transferase n=1 Tax=Massilia frigida TaxID=2609281 RepID=A0ABX0N1W2_9BURK|nr:MULTISPECIES: FAD:protein FMN transferase [Massilia]MDM5177558.1 FAD:protein FMN transferase [Massilia sp. DJPM01]NHZ79292.1 FAD:protein FMN transferase [Massilia frigida]